METRFKRATISLKEKIRKNWGWGLIWLLVIEPSRDGLYGWAIEASEETAGPMKEATIQFFVDYAENPISWVLIMVILAILIVLILFIHSYFSAKVPETKVVGAVLSKPKLKEIKRKRIPLTILRRIARKQGWKVDQNSYEGLDLLAGIRQAALDEDLRVFGREMKYTDEALNRIEMLKPIPTWFWEKHQIDISGFLNSDDNFWVQTRSVVPQERSKFTQFADLYLNRKEGLSWLDGEALEHKGGHEKAFEKRVGK